MSTEPHQKLLAAADALGSVRAEGLEPTSFGLQVIAAVVNGTISGDVALERLVAHHRR